MRQFVLPREMPGGGQIRIEDADSKYILKVLRLNKGDTFPAVDKQGKRYHLKITDTGSNYFTADCSETEEHKNEELPSIILIQCLPKGKKLETIVRQAVEGGVSKIIPVQSENSVAVIKEDRNSKKTERLEKIAQEAAQQSGNSGVPEITAPIKMKDLQMVLESQNIDGVKLFFHQDRLAKKSLHRYLSSKAKTVCILIGPEGGFSPNEVNLLIASGFLPVYLGGNVLRTETAAIYALGAVKTILLEREEWKTDIQK
ncbi:MAG: RsmE family RNA methyltransferase [Spirochaetales bacterium]|nr:RsmE family RNA methyltransferase [Spirochaetales bacterium]